MTPTRCRCSTAASAVAGTGSTTAGTGADSAPGWSRPLLSIGFVNIPGQFVGPLGNLANGIDLSIPVGLGLAAVLYPALLWAFPEPADAFGPDGPRAVPVGPPANTPITSMDKPRHTRTHEEVTA